jgi:hypothetical protein
MNARAWYSPADIARERGVRLAKVRAWISSGELEAVNVAARSGPGLRPRWRISADALAAFDRVRSSRSAIVPKTSRRSSLKKSEVLQFF